MYLSLFNLPFLFAIFRLSFLEFFFVVVIMKVQYLAALLGLCQHMSMAVSTFSPARPPAIPLAVKSPYMNTYLFAGSDGGNGGYLAGQWPQFWALVVAPEVTLP